MMTVGYAGSPAKGYEISALLDKIDWFLDPPQPQNIALVGVGNLGRAILAFFTGRRPNLKIAAAFDKDPFKTGRLIMGCHCYPADELHAIIHKSAITMGVIAVPAGAAQTVADQLVDAGVCGILNFAPIPLRVPPRIYVEDIDLTTSLDKVAYFACEQTRQHEERT
jgi:redox-sensing transcriptional repressor